MLAWAVAMTALIQRDVVPFWTAQQPPAHVAHNSAFQVAIHNAAGTQLGTSWVTTTPIASITTVRSTTLLDLRRVASILSIQEQKPLLVETDLTYYSDGLLDRFRFRLLGAGMPIQVVGERYGRDFACTTTFGRTTRTIPLDGRLSECLAETLRPFTLLKDLHVGQTWRIRLLDPLSLLRGSGPDFKMQLVTVTRRETIDHHGDTPDCFRIETDGTVAWADDTGRVLRQEVRIPLLGTWTLTDEPFDGDARKEALAWVRAEHERRQAAVTEDWQP